MPYPNAPLCPKPNLIGRDVDRPRVGKVVHALACSPSDIEPPSNSYRAFEAHRR